MGTGNTLHIPIYVHGKQLAGLRYQKRTLFAHPFGLRLPAICVSKHNQIIQPCNCLRIKQIWVKGVWVVPYADKTILQIFGAYNEQR
ncbi:MAG: hypothetical protein COC17_02730 [Hyphomicrobiales bacterium]|nr:MAG: hypothetical protein COC17_02730 [Hyphomicrobiales bacterium]